MKTQRAGSKETGHGGASLASLLQDSLGRGVVIVRRGKPPQLNEQALRLCGVKQTGQGKRAQPNLPKPLLAFAAAALASPRRLAPRRIPWEAPGRSAVVLHATALPLFEHGKKTGVMVWLSDASAGADLNSHLHRVERLASVGTLAAGLAHEIKNALVAGKTFIELLLEKNQDAELAQIVRREMERVDALVGQMLRFGGSDRPSFSAVRLHEILDHSLRLVRPQLKGKAISLSQMFRAEPDVVEGDDFQLQQAFVNLFLNALEAMGPNGTLTVATETLDGSARKSSRARLAAERQLRIIIQDTGMGIPEDIRARLFEPFFTTKQSGTGLGLPITRRIIEEHRGDISVESRPNEGATFSIVLPIREPASISGEPSTRAHSTWSPGAGQ